jgi:hypothetical protein
VSQLNIHGVSGLIATAAKVDPYLAGDFFATLERIIREKQGHDGYPISLAYFKAVTSLRDMQSSNPNDRGRTYGAKVLAYELLGNGNIHICLPTR